MGETFRVRDAMTSPVATEPPTASLQQVAERMLDDRIGCVVIVDEHDPGKPVGVVTESDFEVQDNPVPFTFFHWPRLFGEFVWSEESMKELYEAARSRTADSIMSSPVVTVGEDEELWAAVRTMVANDIKRLPVLREGRLVGILTRRDLLKLLVTEQAV